MDRADLWKDSTDPRIEYPVARKMDPADPRIEYPVTRKMDPADLWTDP